MFQNTIMILLFILLNTHAHAENSLKGHWISIDQKNIAEFTEDKITITLLSEHNDTIITANIKEMTESRYHLYNKEHSYPAILVVDWKKNIFSIHNMRNHFHILNFQPAPQITQAELLGTWYTHERIDDNYETSTIVTQKGETYDYDFLEISHDEKSYTRDLDKDVKFTIKNGFSFHENTSESEEYIYYLTSSENNTLYYTGSYGDTWSEHRKEGATHPDIPEGYTEKKAEDE